MNEWTNEDNTSKIFSRDRYTFLILQVECVKITFSSFQLQGSKLNEWFSRGIFIFIFLFL